MSKKEKEIKKEEELTAPDKTRNFIKALVPYVVIIFIVMTIRTFLVTPVRVTGSSMDPYLKDGEILILNKTDKKYDRFDIVVADAANTKVIKRVIGLPGENVEYKNCKLYINGKETRDFVTDCITNDFSLEELYGYAYLPEDYYFVMGDNRTGSSDSRDQRIGLIKKDNIDGTVVIRLTPLSKFGSLK